MIIILLPTPRPVASRQLLLMQHFGYLENLLLRAEWQKKNEWRRVLCLIL